MARKHFVTAFIFGLTGVLCFACAEPNWAGDLGDAKSATEPKGDDDDTAKGDDGEQCTPDTTKSAVGGEDKPGLGLDPSTLDACCTDEPGAKAHCVPEDKVSSSKDKLSACGSGGRCLPDAIITGETPKACKSTAIGDPTPGVCLSPCIKKIGDNRGSLHPDGCAAGLLCAPCELGGAPTGACEIGKSSGSKKSSSAPAKACAKKEPATGGDDTKATDTKATDTKATDTKDEPKTGGVGSPCCGDKGLCATKELVESKMPGKSDQLEAKECTGGMLCAPKENAAANFKPKTCKGKALTGAYTGVCLSNCIAFSQVQKLASAQGDCDSDHRCLPCKLLGVLSTGAPGCE